jgi:tropomodulin
MRFQFLSMQALAAGLSENKTLKLLNLESNYISGQGIINILVAINVHQVVTEFKVSNQVSSKFCSRGLGS